MREGWRDRRSKGQINDRGSQNAHGLECLIPSIELMHMPHVDRGAHVLTDTRTHIHTPKRH